MDEKQKLADAVQSDVKRGSGNLLAAARKQQGKTVEEIAGELNLSVTQIRTIESDQSEGLPEPTYVRGYIRSYARLLNLDADHILEHYLNPNWQKGARLDDMPRDIGSAEDDHGDGFFTPFKLIVLLLLAAGTAYLFASGKLNEFGVTGSNNASPAKLSASVNPGNQTSGTAVASGNSIGDSGDDELSRVDDTPSVEVETPQSSGDNTLSLSFSDTSWIDIRDGNGERMAYKSYSQGEVLSVSSATNMSVFIGNAKAVSADLNGNSYDISKYREGVFARFTIGSTEE